VPNWLAGGLIAFGVAVVTTPVGVSGAVFLLPVQVSVLHVPTPALTPTNLLYNVFATPGALVHFARSGRLVTALSRAILLGSLPGVIVGAFLRVEVLPGRQALYVIVAAVLLPLGVWLLTGRPGGWRARPQRRCDTRPLGDTVGVTRRDHRWAVRDRRRLAARAMLAATGYSLFAVAPATLLATFATSVVGVVTFQLLALIHSGGTIAPKWLLGCAMGIGGTLGSYLGAALQPRLPEHVLRPLLGAVSILLALRYLIGTL